MLSEKTLNYITFDFILILKECLKGIDYLSLLDYLEKINILHDNLRLPYFYFLDNNITKHLIKKIKNDYVVNINIVDKLKNLTFKKLSKLKTDLFRFEVLNQKVVHKYIWSLIKNINNLILFCEKNKKIEFCKRQLDFLEIVIVRFVPNKILN